jgi:hypothetical protein
LTLLALAVWTLRAWVFAAAVAAFAVTGESPSTARPTAAAVAVPMMRRDGMAEMTSFCEVSEC